MKLSKANVCAGGYCVFLVRGRIPKNECPNFASVRTESFQIGLGDCPADVLREKVRIAGISSIFRRLTREPSESLIAFEN